MPKKSPKIGQKQAVAPGFTLDYKGWAFTKSGLYVKPFQVEEPSDPGKRWFIRGYPYDVRADKAILRRFTVTPDYIASPDWDRTRKRAAARLMALEWNELLYNDQLFTNAPPPPKQEYRADMPITEAIDYFLKMAGYDHKKGTVRQYKDSLSKFKTWLTQTHRDKMRLNKFTRSDSLLYLDWLKLSKLAPATVNNHHTCLGVLFGFYIKKDIAVDYPLKNIPSLKATPTKYTAYSREQRANIREYLTSPATGDDMLLLFISLMYYTLARPGEEIRLLRVGDIGQQSITFWGENVKNSKTKTIPIEPGLEELLTKINIRSYPPDLYVFG